MKGWLALCCAVCMLVGAMAVSYTHLPLGEIEKRFAIRRGRTLPASVAADNRRGQAAGVGQILCGNAYLMDITVKSLFESHDLFYLLFSLSLIHI